MFNRTIIFMVEDGIGNGLIPNALKMPSTTKYGALMI